MFVTPSCLSVGHRNCLVRYPDLLGVEVQEAEKGASRAATGSYSSNRELQQQLGARAATGNREHTIIV